jgi:hypothetical protein
MRKFPNSIMNSQMHSQTNRQHNMIHNYNNLNQTAIKYGLEEKKETGFDLKSAKEKFYALKAKKNKRHFHVIYMFKNKYSILT